MKKIKSITSYRSDIGSFDSSISDDKLYKYHEIEFNKDNKTLREAVFSPSGKVIEEVINKYDDNGNLVENILHHTSDGTSEKTTYKHDSKGNVVEEVIYFGDEPFEKVVSSYDAHGNKYEVIKYDEDNQPMERDVFEYNANNKAIKQIHYNEDGEPEWEIEIDYDEKGNNIKEKHKNFAEGKEETISFTYNEEGKRTRTEVHDKSGRLVTLITDEYDENGNKLKQISQSSGRYPAQNTRTIVYDEQNRPVEIMVYDDMRKFLSSQEIYTYDENGHITEREVYELSAADTLSKNHYRLKLEYEFFS